MTNKTSMYTANSCNALTSRFQDWVNFIETETKSPVGGAALWDADLITAQQVFLKGVVLENLPALAADILDAGTDWAMSRFHPTLKTLTLINKRGFIDLELSGSVESGYEVSGTAVSSEQSGAAAMWTDKPAPAREPWMLEVARLHGVELR